MTPTERMLMGEVTRLKQDIAIRPIRVPTRGGAAPPPVISRIYVVVGGNTVPYLGGTGIKHVNTAITTVPAGIDVATMTPSTLPDGLGWGYLIDDMSYALLINDVNSFIQYDLVAQPVFAAVPVVLAPTSPDTANVIAYRILGIV